MKLLKFTAEKESDNIETVAGLDEELRSWVRTVGLPFEGMITSVENFEFRSRDGFSAHRHNCGGVDLLVIESLTSLIGSGTHYGLKIEDKIEKSYNDNLKYMREQYPDKTDEEIDSEVMDSNSEYDDFAYRIRLMYEGNGVLRVYAGFDLDAPYFRWSNANDFEAEIKFKTISGLRRQLDRLVSQIEKTQYKQKKTKVSK